MDSSAHLTDLLSGRSPADRIEPILGHLSTTERSATLVAGGYFESANGINEFSRNSFTLAQQLGAAIRQRHRGNKVLYDVIHNDLGTACDAAGCLVVPAAETATSNLKPLEDLAQAAETTFTVTRERTLRNRAGRTMRTWLKSPESERRFIRNGEEILFSSRQYEKILAGVTKDDYVVPRCPLIVSEYFTRHFPRLRAYRDCTHSYIIIVASFADKDKLTKGAEIYLRRQGNPNEVIILVLADATCSNIVEMPFSTHDF